MHERPAFLVNAGLSAIAPARAKPLVFLSIVLHVETEAIDARDSHVLRMPAADTCGGAGSVSV